MNAIRFPSDDQAGQNAWPGCGVRFLGSPPADGITQMSETM